MRRCSPLLVVLMYHQVHRGDPVDSYSISADELERQVRILAAEGFTSVIPQSLDGSRGSLRRVMITFDDGYVSDYTVCLPLLKERGMAGVSFVTTSRLDSRGYLSWEQCRKLAAAGFSVQSHTHTHPLLGELDYARLRDELAISRIMIESRLGTRVTALSFPGGSHSARVRAEARTQGYSHFFSSLPGYGTARDGVFCRIRPMPGMGADLFRRLVTGDAAALCQPLARYFAAGACRLLAGPGRYHALWSLFKKPAAPKGGV